MRSYQSLLALATIAICASCSSSVDSLATSDIAGRWVTPSEGLRPAGLYGRQLTFTNDGRFVSEVRSYGVYPKQRPEDLSSYTRIIGTFAVAGDQLSFEPESLITWDSFYGADSPEMVQTPYPYGSLYDDARFRIDGETLTLDFTTYPADAPEPTRQVFQRDR